METIHDHLLSRYMDFDLHHMWINEEERMATFPLYNLSGQMVGYQRYRPDQPPGRTNNPLEGRYFTRCARNTVRLWGLESYHLTPGVLFITEGIFDAARLTRMGISTVAVLGNASSPELKQWLAITGRYIIAVCDNDKAGRALARHCQLALLVQKGDLGEEDQKEIEKMVDWTKMVAYNTGHTLTQRSR